MTPPLHEDGPSSARASYHKVLPLEFRLDVLGLPLLSSVTSCVTLGHVFPMPQRQAGSSPSGSPKRAGTY